MQQPVQEPVATLLYRLETMEREFTQLKVQLNLYEPTRESDLKIQRINDTVGRIEVELTRCKEKLETMNTTLIAQDSDSKKRDNETNENLNKLQIKVLWGIISTVIAVLVGILIGYANHLLH